MGIQVEFNPDLALRNWTEYKAGRRKQEECIQEIIKVGKTYAFLKKGQRLYWLHGEMPLVETSGNQQLSRPKASIVIKWVKHFLVKGEVYTTGEFEVIEVFFDDSIHFEGFAKVSE